MEMPPDRAKPGRPKKLRRLEHDEVVPQKGTHMTRKYVSIKCSMCGKVGHNAKTCYRRQQEEQVTLLFYTQVFVQFCYVY